MKKNEYTRKEFLKFISSSAIALGLSKFLSAKDFLSEETIAKKPAVIWLEAQDCAGCTESIFASLNPDLRDVLVDTIALRYHETVMSGTGHKSEEALTAAIDGGDYILVVEGAIPFADPRFLTVAGVSVEETFVNAARKAGVILAVGACSAFGGIPKAGITDGQSVEAVLNKYSINKTFFNLPGCPAHPAWFFDTVNDLLKNKSISVDIYKRPLKHFGTKLHRLCPRKQSNKGRKFLTDWNDPAQENYCLEEKGCKGKYTFADCARIKWNDGVNWCIGNNAPCAGCTEPGFYENFSPLFKKKCKWQGGR